jgi:hypothetical protein
MQTAQKPLTDVGVIVQQPAAAFQQCIKSSRCEHKAHNNPVIVTKQQAA